MATTCQLIEAVNADRARRINTRTERDLSVNHNRADTKGHQFCWCKFDFENIHFLARYASHYWVCSQEKSPFR